MEKGRARQFQLTATDPEQCWNVVEFSTRTEVRQKITQLLRQCADTNMTTADLRLELLQGVASFGNSFATQLVRSLDRDDNAERQSLIWLITVLASPTTIPPLRQMAADLRLPRKVRLAASLALAGLGVTAETISQNRRGYL